MTRPLSAIECYRAAERLMGASRGPKIRDMERTTYVPTWAASKCSCGGTPLVALGEVTGTAYSTAFSRVCTIENCVSASDREEARRCIREDALRHREGKRGSMPTDLRKRLRAAVLESPRTWRERRTRMNPDFVRAIRCSSVSTGLLARFLGMPHSQISMVRSRKIWGWVDDVQDDGIVQG